MVFLGLFSEGLQDVLLVQQAGSSDWVFPGDNAGFAGDAPQLVHQLLGCELKAEALFSRWIVSGAPELTRQMICFASKGPSREEASVVGGGPWFPCPRKVASRPQQHHTL